MSLVTIMSANQTATGDAVANRTWRLPVSGLAGEASFTVPYGSPLEAVLDLYTGSSVLIHDADEVGAWSGFVMDAEWTDAGIAVTAQQVWSILGKRSTTLSGQRRALAPGALVTEIIRDTGLVLGMTMPDGPSDGDSPVVGLHTWDGQDAWGFISEQMGRSENELWIDPETREVSWIGPLAAASMYPNLLIAGQSFTNWRFHESNRERVTEVVGVYDGATEAFGASGTRRYTARYGEAAVAGFPASATITADVLYVLRDLVHIELNRRAFPSVVLTGEVTRVHRAIRERDFVQVVVPKRGLTLTCRVLARTVADDARTIGLELLVVPLNPITTMVKPPGAPSRDISRGTGSLAQRIVRMTRRIR